MKRTIVDLVILALALGPFTLYPPGVVEAAARSLPQGARSAADTSNRAVARRVWVPPSAYQSPGSISPDGSYLSYTDWMTGDLAVLDLATRETRRVTDNRYAGGAFAEASAVSPDGRQIAYSWFNGELYELRVVGLDGTGAKGLYQNQEGRWLMPVGWAPDGTHVLALVVRRDGTRQTILVSTIDGSHRQLQTSVSWRGIDNPKFSPDGRFIAYTSRAGQDSQQRDIFVHAADGTREFPLVQHPADDDLLGWAPNGETILFRSDRAGTTGVWAIRVTDGEPEGEPLMVKGDVWGLSYPMGFTRAGSFYSPSTSDEVTSTSRPSTRQQAPWSELPLR